MKTTTVLAVGTLSVLVGIAGAQQVHSSSQAAATNNTSVSASRSGASAQSDSNADATSRTSVTEPERQREPKEARESKNSGRSKGRERGNAEAGGNLASGTTVNAVLSKPLDSRKAKPGDRVDATAAKDVKGDDGKVAIHRGSHLVGHVTEAKGKAKGESNSSLGIVFDHAVLKDGEQVPMHSVVQALAAAQTGAGSSFGDDDLSAVGGGGLAGGGAVASRDVAGGGGLVGGVASTAGAATGAVANVGGATGAIGSTVGSTVGSTANVGNGLHGALGSTSSGVIGLSHLSLASEASNATQGSVITSPDKSVHLDSGTQMLLRVVQQ